MIAPRQSISSEDVARHYDELDAFYRELWGEHVHHGLWLTGMETPEQAAQQLVERVAQAAAIRTRSTVCDIGCGYGATARWLATEHQAQVTGITVSPHQHRYAQAQSVDGVPPPTYLLQDWLHTTLPEHAFDAALFIESLAHMEAKQEAIARAHRVLRPGGRIVACVWLAAPYAPAWTQRFLLEPICYEGQLPSLPTAEAYQQWLRAAGFIDLRYEDISTKVQRTWTVVIQRVLSALVRRSDYRRYLLSHAQHNRRFALTLIRLWLAFRAEAFRYGVLSAQKPS